MKLKIALVAAACCAAGAVGAAPQYTTSAVQINRAQASDYLGKVAIASPVTVLAQKGGKAQVRISGWALKEYPSQIFAAPGVRIEYASFDEENVVKLDPKAGSQTVQGNEWVKATAVGWVDAQSLTGDIEGLWKQGKARLAAACSSCHGAPSADHFTANQWAGQLPERGGRAGHSRKGNNALMFKYLQEHAKK